VIDLHLHSSFSDGALTPAELVKRASNRDVTAIALTDHDTCEGNGEALAAGRALGVKVLAGVELSVQCGDVQVHLLGYGVDRSTARTRGVFENLTEERGKRLSRIVYKLNELGMPISSREVLAESGGGITGRLHVGRVMARRRFVSSVGDAFSQYLGRGGLAYVDRVRLDASEAMELIAEMGGVASLAHPGVLEGQFPDDLALEKVLERFVPLGLAGIEAHYSRHNPEQVARYLGLCEKFDLIATGGSDFHRPTTSGPEIGSGSGKLRVPPESYEQLVKAIETRRA
jgi:predicted metal-dependent phosphoesterase TrpH